MSPEHVAGGHQNHLSDLYAAGVVLFELLAGQPPFKDEGSPLKLLEEIRSKPAPGIRTLGPTRRPLLRISCALCWPRSLLSAFGVPAEPSSFWRASRLTGSIRSVGWLVRLPGSVPDL